jgi:ParB family chromosome partitioning protein
MTSGSFRSVPLDSIKVDRDRRQRRELSEIPVLADSIARLGLIQPIVVTRDFDLVAGERRLAACKYLGHTNISIQFVDELEDHILRAIELEENIKRQNLPWQDECMSVYEYFQIRRVETPGFSQEDLATALGLAQPNISKRLLVAKELIDGNQRVAQAPRFSTAVGITERSSARKDQAALDALRSAANIAAPIVEPDPILNSDFNEWVKTYDGPRFNFVHCDFPYGIESDSFNQGAASTHGGYVDTARTYWVLCESLSANLDRLTTESCHFLFWFSMHNYHSTLHYFAEHSDIAFDPFPLVWLKSDNVGILPDPQRGPRRIYETAFFGSRGDRKIVNSISNAYAAPTDRGFHMSVKPEPVLRNFFRMFVDENTLMLDPTCGSGSSLRAAESLYARYVLGLEINNDFCEQANRALKNARILRRPK